MNIQRTLFFLALIGMFAGVTSVVVAEEADDAEAAEADAEAETETEEAAVAPAASNYDIDAAHSSLVFRIKHLDVGYVFGMFREFDGSFEFDEENPEESSFNFTIAANSVFTNVQDRDDHLRSPDFFAVEEHPEMTFASTAVEKTGDNTYKITGDFTMRGVTQELSLIADQTGTGVGRNDEFRRGFITTFAVNRMDHGVDFMPDGLGEYVRVTLSIQGIAQEDSEEEPEA